MHKKLLLLLMLLSINSALLSMNGILDCVPRIIAFSSLTTINSFMRTNRKFNGWVKDNIDCIIADKAISKNFGLIDNNLLCTKALIHYLHFSWDKDKSDEQCLVKEKICTQLLENERVGDSILKASSCGNTNTVLYKRALYMGDPFDFTRFNQPSESQRQKDTYQYLQQAVKRYKITQDCSYYEIAKNIARKNKFDLLESNDFYFEDLLLVNKPDVIVSFLSSVGYQKKDQSGSTVLLVAYSHGNRDVVKLALEEHVGVDRFSLVLVCMNDDIEMMQLFLAHGVDVNTELELSYKGDWYSGTLLEFMRQHVELYKELLGMYGSWSDKCKKSCTVPVVCFVTPMLFLYCVLECNMHPVIPAIGSITALIAYIGIVDRILGIK
jgi:hypothetical protein